MGLERGLFFKAEFEKSFVVHFLLQITKLDDRVV